MKGLKILPHYILILSILNTVARFLRPVQFCLMVMSFSVVMISKVSWCLGMFSRKVYLISGVAKYTPRYERISKDRNTAISAKNAIMYHPIIYAKCRKSHKKMQRT